MANITNVNELWGRKWRFKDDTPSPSEFSLRNSVEGVKFATFYLGEEVKEVYQTDNSVGNVGITTQGTFIRIGVSESSFTYAHTANGWVGKPAILEFIENTNNYTLSCINEENFITWFNENATEYVPPLNEWTKGVADAIREKKGTSGLIKPLDFAKEISSIEAGSGGDTLKALLDYTKSTNRMFYENQTITDLTGLIPYNATSNVTNMSYMFYNCDFLTIIPLFDTSNVNDMSYMFSNIAHLTTIPQFDTSKVTNMSYMFSSCSNLTSIPQLDTSNVTKMSSMFSYCYNLTSVPQFDTSNVTDMNSMFSGCGGLTTIPLFDTSKVSSMSSMFYYCSNLTSVPQLNTSKVTNISSMFYNCSKLTTIPLFDTSKVSNMNYMFYECSNLTTIPQLNASNVTSMNSMFYNCSKLKSILMYGMKVNFSISSSTEFEREDLVTILNNLATVTGTKTLTMGSTNLAKLTDEDKAIATNKGWTLA